MTERVEQKIRCPKDGRTVASVVASSDGGRHLVIVGGRVGAHATTHSTVAKVAESFPGVARLANPAEMVITASRRRINSEPPGWVSDGSMPEERECDDVWPGRVTRAVCPRCHSVFTLAVESGGVSLRK